MFDGAGPIVTFPNLSSDAVLVSPNTLATSDGAHLAAFVRAAPRTLSRALWAAVGEAVLAHASHDPLWVGTAGLGVYWVHVRLDQHPKYYRYAPFTPRGA